MSRLGSLLGFVKYVWTRADRLLPLLETLPESLREAGAGMEEAGAGAVAAGKAVGGEESAAAVLRNAANAVEECHKQMQGVAQLIDELADALDKVRIPKLTPVTQELDLRVFGQGKPKLVTGIDLNDQGPGLFANVTHSMRAQAQSMRTNIGGQLHEAAENLSGVSQNLDRAGDRLNSLGSSLKKGGAALRRLGV